MSVVKGRGAARKDEQVRPILRYTHLAASIQVLPFAYSPLAGVRM